MMMHANSLIFRGDSEIGDLNNKLNQRNHIRIPFENEAIFHKSHVEKRPWINKNHPRKRIRP